jgi:hypothetical protein
MDVFSQIATKIIEQQELIIGPVAVQQAEHVEGLSVDWAKHEVQISGDKSTTIDQLVKQFEDLFGKVAVEASKEATSQLVPQIPEDKVPKSLR